MPGKGETRLAAWHRGLAALLFLAGFLLVVQLRAEQAVRAGLALPSYRLGDLSVLMRRQQQAGRALTDEVRALAAKQQRIDAAITAGRSIVAAMRHELTADREQLGLTPVSGPGITITLAADPRRLSVPQAQDVAGVMNELWAAGAEAVSVNGIRALATDGVVQVTHGVQIAGRETRDPYAISAIGDPAALVGALMVPGGAVGGLRGVGIVVTLARAKGLRLPAAVSTPAFRVAQPIPGP